MSDQPPWNRLESVAGAVGLTLLVAAMTLWALHQWIIGGGALGLCLIAAGDALYASWAQAGQSGFKFDHGAKHRVRRLIQSVDAEHAAVALTMIGAPKRYMRIVTQYVEPRTRAVSLETRYLIHAVPNFPQDFFAPVIMSKKGDLHDRFIVRVDGVESAYSTFEESSNYIIDSMRSLVAEEDRANLSEFDALEDAIWEEITKVDSLTRREWREQTQRVCDLVHESKLNPNLAAIIEATIDLLSENYVICVSIPSSSTVEVQTSELRIIHRSRQAALANSPGMQPGRVVQSVRRFFGVRTATIAVDISKAYRSREYHLEVMGPVGTYLAHVVASHRRELFRGYIRLRSRAGQRYLHFFGKDVRRPMLDNNGQKNDFDPVFGGVYFERPPGSLLSATASASAAAFIIVMVGHLDLASKGSGLDALLLAAPGAVVGWTGFGDAKLVGVTVCSRVYATATLVITMFSLGLLILESSQPNGLLHRYYSYGWKILMISAISIAAASLYSLTKRQIRHSLTLREGGIRS